MTDQHGREVDDHCAVVRRREFRLSLSIRGFISIYDGNNVCCYSWSVTKGLESQGNKLLEDEEEEALALAVARYWAASKDHLADKP